MSIEENIKKIQNEVDSIVPVKKRDGDVIIIAASKTQTAEVLKEYYKTGYNVLGENRVQEFLDKYDKCPKFEWHFIGRLQTNKVKYIIDKVSLIHSLDRLELASEIQKQCEKKGITMSVLIEVNIGHEENKGGIEPDKLMEFCESLKGFDKILVKGLMCVLPANTEEKIISEMCLQMHNLYDKIKELKYDNFDILYLSMGMTNDYKIAVKYGANMIRIGRAIFGERKNYGMEQK